VVIAVACMAAVASAGGLLIATSIKSPAQVAAATAAPAPTQLTVPVTRQVITGTVLTQGKVKPPPEVSQPAGGGQGGELSIVTRTFLRRGETVRPGQVIVEVSGRPLFALLGAVPAYRSLGPGDTGADVTQLQQGLASLGYPAGFDPAGTFGPGTAAAVTAFYTALGYPVPPDATVPRTELMFVPQFPARVITVAGPVGHLVKRSLATLATGSPVIAGQVTPGDGGMLKAGMAVTITDPATGTARRGTIRSVGRQTQSAHSLAGGLYLPAKVRARKPMPLSLIGRDVSLSISSARSHGPVLAVPEAAIFARPDGNLYVTVLTGTGTGTGAGAGADRQVPVRIGVTGNGLVGVTPTGTAKLAAGDRVVVGASYAPPRPGSS
jgi:peptidoglycan hydrolase-like protein with peptidoglycan-binding domain